MFKVANILRKDTFIALFAVAFLSGCASQQADLQTSEPEDDLFASTEDAATTEEANDPLETFNRFVFAFNEAADTLIIRPAAEGYRFIVPEPIQNNIRNFIRNTQSPVILANNLLQGDLEAAENTFTRFFLNTIVGLGGIIDIAGEHTGHEYRDEDFGQTLATWGVGEGPYLVLPILGPSNARDGVGLIADILIDPLTYTVNDDVLLGRAIVDGLDTRARNIESLDALKEDSLDYYARIRSVYGQLRENQIRNVDSATEKDTPDLGNIFPEDDDQLSYLEE
ncbi:MlaA family lipoprotein [Kiloniella sp. b19]|uniref:MlaA family lipoprotein n=1 Tax=Kiloniella sp. GXU_MW_B19 TaxID=3141326 RepID=UPI0031D3576A